MAYDVVRPLIHEVLTKVNNAKVKGKKITPTPPPPACIHSTAQHTHMKG